MQLRVDSANQIDNKYQPIPSDCNQNKKETPIPRRHVLNTTLHSLIVRAIMNLA